MKKPDTRKSALLDELSDDLVSVIRRHDPEWTGHNSSDPGITLLQVEAWLAEQIYSSRNVNAGRTDPYRSFKFRVQLDGAPVSGVTRISVLRRTTEIIEHRDGNDPSNQIRRIPGKQVYEPITLERPLGADRAFEDWADLVAGTATGGVSGYRKNVRIEVLEKAERVLIAFDAYDCWPSEHRVLPDLTESITLVADRWQRDRSV